MIAGTSTASAQTAKDGEIPTIDWKTVKPGSRANDLYAEQGGFNDTDVTWWAGRNVSGLTIGLIQFQANLPMIPGNMGNATTFVSESAHGLAAWSQGADHQSFRAALA